MARPRTVAGGVFAATVVCDTREQDVYTFAGLACDKADGGGPLTVPTVRRGLASGDYSLAGYEARVAVERKSAEDCYGTIGQGRDRFERELERLSKMEVAFVVVEATWPQLVTEPPRFTQLSPKTVFRSIVAWQVRYPTVHWLACGPRRLAEVTTFRLLERFLKEDLARLAEKEG